VVDSPIHRHVVVCAMDVQVPISFANSLTC
jgi:hypothetical protein